MNIFIIKLAARLADTWSGTTLVRTTSDSVFWFSSKLYSPQAGDANLNQTIYPRLINPGTVEKHMWKPSENDRHSLATFGFIELANPDSVLDFLANCAVDGRYCYIYYGDESKAFSTFTIVYQAVGNSITVAKDILQINMRDEFSDAWENVLNKVTYLGNNALPNGIEGVTDLAGKYKPLVWGSIGPFTPPCVNTSQLIYQISNQSIAALNVYNNGVIITPGTNRGTVAALQAATPTAGTYDYSLGSSSEGCYIKLGSSPGNGTITAQASDRATSPSTNNSAGNLVQRILVYGLPFDAATVASLTSAVNQFPDAIAQGVYCDINSSTTMGSVVDSILQGLQACCIKTQFGPNAGKFGIVQLVDPASYTPVYYFTDQNMVPIGDTSLEVLDLGDLKIPPYMLRLYVNRYYTVQSGANLAGVIDAATKADLGQEYRLMTQNDSTTWDPVAKTGRHPTANVLELKTQMFDALNGTRLTNELNRQFNLFSEWTRPRYYVRFGVFDFTLVNTIDLGSIVNVKFPRLGFQAGINLIVTGIYIDFFNHRLELFGWG